MVEYQPPERVLLTIGATFRAEPLQAAALRLAKLAAADMERLQKFGIAKDVPDQLRKSADQIRASLTDPAVKKADTPLQMAELAELMAEVRSWLRDLRDLALVNLSLDRPAIEQIASVAPEVADGYARDLLEELKHKVRAAWEMRARLEDSGLNRRFIDRGARLSNQLQTAIGVEDLDPKNLRPKVKVLYNRKGHLYQLTKRVSRAGRYALRSTPARAQEYLLPELEPDVALRR